MLVLDSITKKQLLTLDTTETTVERILTELAANFFYYKKDFVRVLSPSSKLLNPEDIVTDSEVYVISLFNNIFSKNIDFFGPKLFEIEYNTIKADFPVSEIRFQKIFSLYNIRRYPNIESIVSRINTQEDLKLELVYEKIKYMVPGIYFKGKSNGNIQVNSKWSTDYSVYINWNINTLISISRNHIKFIMKNVDIDTVYFTIFSFLGISESFRVTFEYTDIQFEHLNLNCQVPWIHSNIQNITNLIKQTYSEFYNYNLFSDSIHIIPKKKENFSKIIIHKGPGLTIEIKGTVLQDFHILFDFVINCLCIDLFVDLDSNFTKKNTVDCQKGRQPNLILGTAKNENEMNINRNEKISCLGNGIHVFPGYTKNGTTCCFKNQGHTFLKFQIFGKDTFFEPISKLNFISKEKESDRIKSNVCIIELDNTKKMNLQRSEYPYAIYKTFTIYLFDTEKKNYWILKNTGTNVSTFESSFGFVQVFPKLKGLLYYKNIVDKGIKGVTGQIVDSGNNVTFLVYKENGLIAIKSQPKISGLAVFPLFIPNVVKQRKILKQLNVSFKESERFIILVDSLIKIPLNEFALTELLELDEAIYN